MFWTTLALATLPRSARPVHVPAERSEFQRLPDSERRIKRFLYRRCSAVTANNQLAVAQVRSLPGVTPGRVHFLRVRVYKEAGQLCAASAGDQNTGILSTLLKANAIAVLPADKTRFLAGQEVDIHMLADHCEFI